MSVFPSFSPFPPIVVQSSDNAPPSQVSSSVYDVPKSSTGTLQNTSGNVRSVVQAPGMRGGPPGIYNKPPGMYNRSIEAPPLPLMRTPTVSSRLNLYLSNPIPRDLNGRRIQPVAEQKVEKTPETKEPPTTVTMANGVRRAISKHPHSHPHNPHKK